MKEQVIFMNSIRELCKKEKDGFKPNLFIVQETDVTTVIISQLYADQGLLISHNAWYGQDYWVLDLQYPELGKRYLTNVLGLDVFKNWEKY